MNASGAISMSPTSFFFVFFQNLINRIRNHIVVLDKDLLFLSYLLVKIRLSPASTAGLESIILSIFFNNIVRATATDKSFTSSGWSC